MLIKGLLIGVLAAGGFFLVAADDYLEKYKSIVAKGAEASASKYWQGDHFGDVRYGENDKIFKGRSSHDFAMTYWNIMDAKLNGNQDSLNRALTNYKFVTGRFWNNEKNLFDTDYDFLMNTSIALAISFSLRDAREVIPPEIQDDMRKRLKYIADYLPTYDTSLLKDGQLRANNQDAFASLALALISEELKDPQIRRNALTKFRQVLSKTQQSFWVEGGVDIGYQSVGEPAFAAAADILWDDLTLPEKKKVADLGLNNVIGNGYGLENSRSSSWIRRNGARAFSSATLGWVPDAKIAADAEVLFDATAQNGFGSRWWLHDPASISFFTGFYKNREAIAAINKDKTLFNCASLACQIMERDESGDWYTGMEKGYMTGDLGLTAMFGDYSRFNPVQASVKFGAKRAPFADSHGNLRYLCYNNQLYVCADDTLGSPRINSVDSRKAPQTISRAMYPGAGGSVYQLQQVLPGLNADPALEVTQNFVLTGETLVIIFTGRQSLQDFTYDLTIPEYYKLENRDGQWKAWQKSMSDDKSRHLGLIAYRMKVAEDKVKRQPYFKNELDLEQKKVKLPSLQQLRMHLDDSRIAVLILTPEGMVRDAKFSETEGVLLIEYTVAKRRYLIAQPLDNLNHITLGPLTIEHPESGFPQLAGFDDNGALICFTGYGMAMRQGDQPWFRSVNNNAPALVSGLRRQGGWLIDVAASAAEINFGQSGESWVDGRKFKLPGTFFDDRIMIQK